MKKIFLSKMSSSSYSYLVTFLSYETNIDEQLKRIRFEKEKKNKVLVDLALVSGVGKGRFAEFCTDLNGQLNIGSRSFVKPSDSIEKYANSILAENETAVISSFLPKSQQKRILQDSIIAKS